jgi:CRP-like cAMP-binding protein
VLLADSDLGSALAGARLRAAQERLVAPAVAAAKGTLRDSAFGMAGPEGLGLLVLDGVIAREVLLSDTVSMELVGPGDVVTATQADEPGQLLRSEVRWTIVEPARLAVLNRQFVAALADYPEVALALSSRLLQRTHRLGVSQAITQLNGVDRRVLAILWHLAERWGQVTGAGIELSLPIPHRIISQLVGARRPTVSTAVAQLAKDGHLTRRPDGGWILHGEPVGLPQADTRRVIALRRRRSRVDDANAPVHTV